MNAEPDVPRFRFAPSPTGLPHVGSLHTALFNWALSRSMGGDLILRIDDTDASRNEPQAADEMVDALRWLGVDWDEGPDLGGDYGPYYQSQRRERHLAVAQQLLDMGQAYREAGEEAIRLRMPQTGQTVVQDALRGAIEFENSALNDPVLVRSDGSPLYHLASVVDDHDMAITHVVRGEEWLSSTPVHARLYELLGWQQPVWVHLPLIRNREGQKLSKREGDAAYTVDYFQDAGYLPQALFNYLLLLGWSPPEGNEIVNKWGVRRNFSLERLSTSPATFDWEKLNWVNRHYLQQHSNKRLSEMLRPYLEDAYGSLNATEEWLERLTALVRDELVRLADVVEVAEWALSETFAFSDEAEAALDSDAARVVLISLVAELAAVVLLDEPTAASILNGLERGLAERHGWSKAQVYRPIRAALTGRVQGPPLAELMALLGKGRCLERLGLILRSG
jgi:glutamyl-tRNA synthetase